MKPFTIFILEETTNNIHPNTNFKGSNRAKIKCPDLCLVLLGDIHAVFEEDTAEVPHGITMFLEGWPYGITWLGSSSQIKDMTQVFLHHPSKVCGH